jgi:antitoxin (DNA-binding transcriptional repressor) of toxin-antitoxin stability system
MKAVGTAELKAHLSAHLREVRRGETITVLDRKQAVAKLVPLDDRANGLVVRDAVGSIHDVVLPGPTAVGGDVVDDLLAERGDRL